MRKNPTLFVLGRTRSALEKAQARLMGKARETVPSGFDASEIDARHLDSLSDRAADQAFEDVSRAIEAAAPGAERLLAHELRTPMTSLIGYAELLERAREKETSQADVERYAGRVLQSAYEVLDLIEHICGGRDTIEERRERVDLFRALSSVCAQLQWKAEAGSVNLILPKDPERIVWGDRVGWARIMTNLIENAIKASPPRGSVVIEFAPLADQLEFRVRDFGAGLVSSVPDDGVPGSADTQGYPSGDGLGLGIVRRLSQSMGMAFRLENHVDGGAQATIVVPGDRYAET